MNDTVFNVFLRTMLVAIVILCRYQDQKIKSLETELSVQLIDCKFKTGELKLSPLP
jgi:hypothetical protein